MPATQTGSPVPAHGVYLVDEDDARRVTLGLVEQVSNPGRPNTNEHLDEFASAYVKEGYSRLAGHRPGQQRLAGSRLAHQQDPLGDPGAQGKEPLRVLEELHHFFEFVLGLFHPGHVGKGHPGTIEGHHPGAAAAEAHGLIVAALGLAHHEQDEATEEDQRQEVEQQPEEAAQAA